MSLLSAVFWTGLQVTTLFFAGPEEGDMCSPLDCGSNSPATGTELHLGGKPNSDGFRIELKSIEHEDHANRSIRLEMRGHELIALLRSKNGLPEELRREDLVGLSFVIKRKHKERLAESEIRVRIAGVDAIEFWYADERRFLKAPTYEFTYTRGRSKGRGQPFELCPFPTEDLFGADLRYATDQGALPNCRQASLTPGAFVVGQFAVPQSASQSHPARLKSGNTGTSAETDKLVLPGNQLKRKLAIKGAGKIKDQPRKDSIGLANPRQSPIPPVAVLDFGLTTRVQGKWKRNIKAKTTCRHDYHALLFAGDRYHGRRIRPEEESLDSRWMTIACKGSASFKMHLSGQTEAALDFVDNNWKGDVARPDRSQKQAFLNAITASYCGPEGKIFTVQGQPLQYDPYFQIDLSKPKFRTPAPSTGTLRFNGPWLQTPTEPEQRDAALEAMWGPDGVHCLRAPRRLRADSLTHHAVEAACEMNIPYCNSSDGYASSPEIPVVTYTPRTCRQIQDDGSFTCTPAWAYISCDCDLGCVERGTCCVDAQEAHAMGCTHEGVPDPQSTFAPNP